MVSAAFNTVLDNGLRVIYSRAGGPISSLLLCIDIYKDDIRNRKIGVAHFAEHAYCGMKRIYGTREPNSPAENRVMQQISFTKEDCIYHLKFFSHDAIRPVMLAEAKQMHRPLINKRLFNRTKLVLMRESLNELEGNYRGRSLERLYHHCLKGTVYERSIIGTSKDIGNINRQDIVDFYNSYYTPDNMILYILSNRDMKAIRRLIVDSFSPMKQKVAQSRLSCQQSPYPGIEQNNIFITSRDNIKDNYYQVVFKIANTIVSRALDLLETLLNEANYCRVVINRLAVDNFSAEHIRKRNLSLFILSFEAGRNIGVQEIMNGISNMLDSLEKKISEADLLRAKKQFCSLIISRYRNPVDRSVMLMDHYLNYGNIFNMDDEIHAIKEINITNIISLICRALSIENALVIKTIPKEIRSS